MATIAIVLFHILTSNFIRPSLAGDMSCLIVRHYLGDVTVPHVEAVIQVGIRATILNVGEASPSPLPRQTTDARCVAQHIRPSC